MPSPAKATVATIIPSFRYRDPKAAIAFLVEAFGFERKAVYEDAGEVVHAELTFGNGAIMLGPVRDTPFGKFLRQPADAGGVTHALFLVIDDVDGHHARALAAGAEILTAPVTQDYGGRDYSCRDPEGFVWSFGDYDPWAPMKS